MTGPSSNVPQFFVNQRRGDIAELRTLLRNLPPDTTQNRSRRREILKRLVAYMTSGIDVSPLFADAVLASATSDVVQKKLLALYLNNYAEAEPDAAILVINAYQKDLEDVDPRIRGLALKALTSLRVKSVDEYAEAAVRKGLTDTSAYVKKYAIMGVLKLFQSTAWAESASDEVKEEFLQPLRKCLQQAKSPQLFITALMVLNEVEGGYKVDRALLVSLFNRMPACTALERTVILSLMTEYRPKTSDELLGLLETIEPNLTVASTSLVLCVLKAMLCLVRNYYQDERDWRDHPLTKSVLDRAKAPLMTLLASASAESNYSVLVYIISLIRLGGDSVRGVLESEWIHFVPQYCDKNYNQLLKIAILDELVSPRNWREIHERLFRSVSPTSTSKAVLRSTLQVLGNIALQYPEGALETLHLLVVLHQMDVRWLSAIAIPTIAAILDQFPEYANEILPSMIGQINLDDLDDKAMQALLWMIGEFPQATGTFAVTVFEKVVANAFASTERSPKLLLKDVLASCAKVLFVYPGAVAGIFLQMLRAINDKLTDLPPDVVERYLSMVRMLYRCPQVLKAVYATRVKSPVPKTKLKTEIRVPSLNLECADLSALGYPEMCIPAQNRVAFLVPYGGYYHRGSEPKEWPAPTAPATNEAADLLMSDENETTVGMDLM